MVLYLLVAAAALVRHDVGRPVVFLALVASPRVAPRTAVSETALCRRAFSRSYGDLGRWVYQVVGEGKPAGRMKPVPRGEAGAPTALSSALV